MKNIFNKSLLVLGSVFVVIQFIGTDKINPEITAELSAPPEIKMIFKSSCYDCHSNQTKWPWYSYVAPVSWLVARDVKEGREHLNFSEWGNYNSEDMLDIKREIWEEIKKGNMPMKIYTYLHGDAVLSAEDKASIKKWALEQE
ncbi:MAG: heme-binding domain-containing protein [Bacteroidetes bacterium]|nr:heme-binding domain-containing protein [Bacteroidota bacterium]